MSIYTRFKGENLMTQKTALILSVVLTAFLLVVGGGVIARVSQPEAAVAAMPTAAPTAAPTASAPTVDVTAQVQELMQQREAQYRQLIDQANQRLADMNQQLAAVQVAQTAPAAPARARTSAAPAPTPAQPAAPQITLSPDSARDIAVRASNFATMIRTPELVRFEGKVAYEVGFTRGVVYVDANSGAVLFNGAQGGGNGGNGGGQPAVQPPAPGGEPEHEGEHEDGHD
jgi:hypothetical protein